jgi:hypothetical protein
MQTCNVCDDQFSNITDTFYIEQTGQCSHCYKIARRDREVLDQTKRVDALARIEYNFIETRLMTRNPTTVSKAPPRAQRLPRPIRQPRMKKVLTLEWWLKYGRPHNTGEQRVIEDV